MFNIGQHVRAVWTNGQLYGASVQQFNGSHYLVVWDDGSPPLWVAADQVQADIGGVGAPIAPGQHVRAQWTNGNWFGARILQFNGAHYEVAWDDGSPNLWIGVHQVQPDLAGAPVAAPQPYGGSPRFTPGQHVRAQWTNGNWFGARILQFNGAQYEVAWDDGSPNLWLAPHQIQLAGMETHTVGSSFAPGQHVRAQWTNGNWYGARVLQQRGDLYEMAWDDGSPNLWVASGQVQPDAGAGAAMQSSFGGGFVPGQHVVAQWTSGQWYGARVVQARGDSYEVAWDDGSPNLWVSAAQIRQG